MDGSNDTWGNGALPPPPPPAAPLPPPPPPPSAPLPPPPPMAAPGAIEPMPFFFEVAYRNAPPQQPGARVPEVTPEGGLLIVPDEEVLIQWTGEVGSFFFPWQGASASAVNWIPGTAHLLLTNRRLVTMSHQYVASTGGKFYGATATTITGDIFGGVASSLSKNRADQKAAQAVAGRVLCCQIPLAALVGIELYADPSEGVSAPKFTVLGGGVEQVLVFLLTDGPPPGEAFAKVQWYIQHVAHHRLATRAAQLDPAETAELHQLLQAPVADTSEGDPAWYLPGSVDLRSL